jgi:hypothetical protein
MSRVKSPTNAHQSTQAERFARVARELGADDNEGAFKAKLGVIARQKPKAEAPNKSENDK